MKLQNNNSLKIKLPMIVRMEFINKLHNIGVHFVYEN